jgi:hypothetical protein
MTDTKNQQTQEIDLSDLPHNVVLMPNIEENIPLPKNAKDAMPEMSVADELNIRAETVKVLSDIKQEPIEPGYNDVKTAEDLAKQMMQNPLLKPEFDTYTNETMAYLAGLVGQTQCMLVKDLADFKLYVVNNLVKVIESTDNPKEKTAALRALGEVDGIDAFKKKTEVTHKVESMEEVEKELISMLNEFKAKGIIKGPPQTIDAEMIETTEEYSEVKDE